MLVTIKKPFAYGADGRNSKWLEAGAEHDIRDDLLPGLSGEGFIDGEPHGLPLLSQGRRNTMIDRIVEVGRLQMAVLTDEQLIQAFESAQHYGGEVRETKIEPPLETGGAVKLPADGESDEGDKDPAPLTIPEDWAAQHHVKIINLAKKFDPAVTTKAEAVAAIEAELAKRAA